MKYLVLWHAYEDRIYPLGVVDGSDVKILEKMRFTEIYPLTSDGTPMTPIKTFYEGELLEDDQLSSRLKTLLENQRNIMGN